MTKAIASGFDLKSREAVISPFVVSNRFAKAKQDQRTISPLKNKNKINLLFGFHGSLILARKLAGYSPRTDQEISHSGKQILLNAIALATKQILVCMIFSFWICSAYGVNGQETFLQANKAYQEKSYEKALTLYSKIEKKGSATWYNMGNCYYQLGHQADALACWNRAQKGASKTVFQDASYNIDVALHDEQMSARKNKWREGSLLLAQLLFLMTWFLFLGGLILSKRGKKYKVATFILGLLVIPQSFYIGYRIIHQNELRAVVRAEANLYAGPNEKYHVVGVLAPKDQVCVYTKNENWYKVALGKHVGWVHSESVIII